MINHLPWAVWPVAANRKVYLSAGFLWYAPYFSHITLADFPVLELSAQMAMAFSCQAKHHQSGSRHIQTVHDSCFRVCVEQSSQCTISVIGRFSRNTEQASRLINNDNVVVPVQFGEFFPAGRDNKASHRIIITRMVIEFIVA